MQYGEKKKEGGPLDPLVFYSAEVEFLVVVFLGGIGTSGWPLAWGIGKYVLILVLAILIKNTNPRVRIDQAMRFFWFCCGPLLVVAVILATVGNLYEIRWL